MHFYLLPLITAGLTGLATARLQPRLSTTSSSASQVCNIPAPGCSSPGPQTTYLPEPCFPSTGACYPINYYAAQDQGQFIIGSDGTIDSQINARCQTVCNGQSQCLSYVATEHISPNGLATGTCFFYSLQQVHPRQCGDSPSRVQAFYKQKICPAVTTTTSASTTRITTTSTSTSRSTTSSTVTTLSTTTSTSTTRSTTTTSSTTSSSSTTKPLTTTTTSSSTTSSTTSSSTSSSTTRSTTSSTTISSSTSSTSTTTSSSTTSSSTSTTTSSSSTTTSSTTSSSTTAPTTSSSTTTTTTSSTTTTTTASPTPSCSSGLVCSSGGYRYTVHCQEVVVPGSGSNANTPVSAANADGCQAVCDNDPTCTGYSYKYDTGICSTFSPLNDYTTTADPQGTWGLYEQGDCPL